jgi:hypothetical protein
MTTHRWSRRFEPVTFIKDRPFDDQGLEAIPDIDAHRDDYRILSWDLEPGIDAGAPMDCELFPRVRP